MSLNHLQLHVRLLSLSLSLSLFLCLPCNSDSRLKRQVFFKCVSAYVVMLLGFCR